MAKPILKSKINIIATIAIILPYINNWLSKSFGIPIIIEPEAAYELIFGAIVFLRTFWTNTAISICPDSAGDNVSELKKDELAALIKESVQEALDADRSSRPD